MRLSTVDVDASLIVELAVRLALLGDEVLAAHTASTAARSGLFVELSIGPLALGTWFLSVGSGEATL